MSAEREAAEALLRHLGDASDECPECAKCESVEDYATHLAAALAAAAGGREAEAFLDSLPADLFSETEVKKLRDWAAEWSAS